MVIINNKPHLFDRAKVEAVIMQDGIAFPQIMVAIRRATINQESKQRDMELSAENLAREMGKISGRIFQEQRVIIPSPSQESLRKIMRGESTGATAIKNISHALADIFSFGDSIKEALMRAERTFTIERDAKPVAKAPKNPGSWERNRKPDSPRFTGESGDYYRNGGGSGGKRGR